MKYIFLVFITTAQLFALDIYLNSAKENNLPYAILHIINQEPIRCYTKKLALDKKNYICKFKKTIKNKIDEKKLRLVNIIFEKNKNEFNIKIIPKFNSKLLIQNKNLYDIKNVSNQNIRKKSKHWIVLIYKKSPFGQKNSSEGINFPVTYNRYVRPFIGPIDLNGAPIAYAKSGDINYYMDIQKEFVDRDYIDVLKDVDRVLKQYPNTIFKSDLLLYKLKTIDECIEKNISPISQQYTNNDILKLAKYWMREFSSNENISEVLMILVKNYLRAGSSSDINYFLDILVNEHKDSPYTKRAILYYADSLYKKNNKKKAMKLYEDVLYSAKNLDNASLAAIRLAKSKINFGDIKMAKQYLLKVLNANKKYLLKDKDATKQLAVRLANNGLYDIAANINDLLLANLDKSEMDTKELLLKRAGDWYAKANDINKTYSRYKQYKKLYKNGIYIDEVNKAIDRLFFKIKETNETKLAKYYDILISKYNNDIKDKAVIEKAKLFLKQKKFQAILDMKKILLASADRNSTIAKDIIKKAAIVLINKNLQDKKCQKVVDLIESNAIDYKKIKNKQNLFKCFLETARYKKANLLANFSLRSNKLKEKFIWLQNSINADVKLEKFDDIISLKDDLFSLAKILKKNIPAPVYRDLFYAYFHKRLYIKALSIAEEIDKNWQYSIKNLDLYYKIINYANNKRDDFLLTKYAKKILSIEKKYSVYSYSPKVDFLYLDALKRLSKIKEANVIAEEIMKIKLNENDKTRALYELGELNYKLKNINKAKMYFTNCANVKIDNSWKKLCQDSLVLF